MSTEALEAYRGMNYDIAEAVAPTWIRRRPQIEQGSTPVREWMLRELQPQAGDTVLELAAGTGDTGFEAAGIVGERGRLLSTDFSPTMLDGARRRGAELGVTNADYLVIDAEKIKLDDDSVDGVVCRFGYMLMADPASAFAETRRVLRPGGRLTLGVWGAPEQNPFFTAIVMSLVQHGYLEPPDPTGPGIFSLARADVLTGLLERAGFGSVRTEEVPVRFPVPDIDEYLEFIADTAGGIALAVRQVSDADRPAVRAQVEAAFERFASPDGYDVPGVARCAVAN